MNILEGSGSYRHFASKNSLPLYLKTWWLDGLCGPEGWGALTLQSEDGEAVAALPYLKRRPFGVDHISLPYLTQFLGPWFSNQSPGERAPGNSKKYQEFLASHLATYPSYAQSWSPDIDNWLPFYWAGFKQTTKYTQRLCLNSSEQDLWDGLDSSCRGKIRKAEAQCIKVEKALLSESALTPIAETYIRQKKNVPFDLTIFEKLQIASESNDETLGLKATDSQGRVVASAFFASDSHCVYYVQGGISNLGLATGAMNLILWTAIKHFHRLGKSVFDFEGSMNPGINSFFKSFGTVLAPYHFVYRKKSRLIDIASFALASLRR